MLYYCSDDLKKLSFNAAMGKQFINTQKLYLHFIRLESKFIGA